MTQLVPDASHLPQSSSAPGFGVAGMVMCPFVRGMCMKSGCELWVELTYGAGTVEERRVGRCSYAWQSILQAEGNQTLIKLLKAVEPHAPQA